MATKSQAIYLTTPLILNWTIYGHDINQKERTTNHYARIPHTHTIMYSDGGSYFANSIMYITFPY